MRRITLFASIVAVGLLTFGLSGCGDSKTPASKDATTPASSTDTHDDHGDHDEHAKMTDMKKMKEGLASLSETDRASAMKQHMCPVSGEMLGTMGEPMKVTVKDQDVWICCNGCKKDLLADPDKYLAKIKK